MIPLFYLQIFKNLRSCALRWVKSDSDDGLCNFEAFFRLGVDQSASHQAPEMSAVRHTNVAFNIFQLDGESHGTDDVAVRWSVELRSETYSRFVDFN